MAIQPGRASGRCLADRWRRPPPVCASRAGNARHRGRSGLRPADRPRGRPDAGASGAGDACRPRSPMVQIRHRLRGARNAGPPVLLRPCHCRRRRRDGGGGCHRRPALRQKSACHRQAPLALLCRRADRRGGARRLGTLCVLDRVARPRPPPNCSTSSNRWPRWRRACFRSRTAARAGALARAALGREEKRRAVAVEAAGLASWVWDVRSGIVECDAALPVLFNLPPSRG